MPALLPLEVPTGKWSHLTRTFAARLYAMTAPEKAVCETAVVADAYTTDRVTGTRRASRSGTGTDSIVGRVFFRKMSATDASADALLT